MLGRLIGDASGAHWGRTRPGSARVSVAFLTDIGTQYLAAVLKALAERTDGTAMAMEVPVVANAITGRP
jgi:hypothetical protein